MRTTIGLSLCVLTLAVVAGGCRRHRPDGLEGCTPGVVYVVACDNEGIGRCSGDPVIRVCDGVESVESCAARSSGFLAEDDDSGGGPPPRATVTGAPPRAFAGTRRGVGSRDFVCDWRVEPVGGGGPLPAPDAGD